MQKKILLFLAYFLLSNFSYAQTVFTESFDSGTTPVGWNNTSNNGGPWEFSTNAGFDVSATLDHTGNGGNYAWVDFSGSDDSVMLVTPTIDVSSLTTPYVSFYHESHYTGTLNPFNLLHVDAWNGSTWVNVASLQGNTSFGWDLYGFNVTNFTFGGGDSLKVRFHAESGGASADYNNDLLIDDVAVMQMPSCVHPFSSSLTANNITGTTADLGWTENGSATSWQIEYGTQGFTQGTGTTVLAGTNPYNLTGLNPTTDYSFYVRSICGVGDSSAWAGPFDFSTICPIAFTPTYSQDFTSYLNPCWSEAEGRLTPSSTLTGTSSAWTSDGFANNGSSGAAKINLYGTTRDEWIISPSIDLGTAATSYQLEFNIALTDWNSTSATVLGSDDTIAVVISTDNGATWENTNILQEWVAGSEPSHTGDHIVINLAAYTGVVKFGFYTVSTVSNEDNDVFIDNFLVTNLASCAAPNALAANNITATTADLAWTENGSATSWQIEYGTQGFTQGTGTPVVTGTNPHNLTSLTANTDYSFYVRAICGAGDSSSWIGPFNFTTLISCPAPSALAANIPSHTTANLAWTENGSATSWHVEYGAQGFAQGTGTAVVTGTNPHNITGLTANTDYSFYVRAICGAGDSSTWVGPFNFTTPCTPFSPTYLEDFTSYLDPCWSEAEGRLTPSSTLTGTSSAWTSDGFANNGSTGAAKINLYGTARDEWIISPSIDLGTAATSYQLEFDIALTDWNNSSATVLGSDDTIAVVISTDNGVTWENANILQEWVAGSEPSHTGDHIVIDLSAYTGIVKFGFYTVSTVSNEDNDVFIDNFLVTNLASCAAPSALAANNITAATADLAWTENGSATSWQIEYGAQGFVQGTGTAVVTGTNPYNATSLTGNTDYSFYVRAICGAGDSSSWAGPFNFSTPCGIYTPTYLEEFTTYVPACWSEAEGILTNSTTLTGTSSAWTSDGFANNGSTGSAKINLYGTSRDEWLISPSIDLGNGTTTYQVEFDIALTDWNNSSATVLGVDDTIAVVVSTDNGATWEKANVLQEWVAGSEPTNTGDRVVINLAAYTGVVKFGFYAVSTVSNEDNDVFIDSFLVQPAPIPTDDVAPIALLNTDSVYCNASVIAGSVVVANIRANTVYNVPYNVVVNGVVVETSTIDSLIGNQLDTIALDTILATTTGATVIQVITTFTGDNNASNDTLSVDSIWTSYTSLSATLTNPIGCTGSANGQIETTGLGGFAPYTYQWNATANNQTTSIATGLGAGTYMVTVTDSIGCSALGTLALVDPPVMSLTTVGTDLNCNDNNSGSGMVTVTGGVPSYSYLWSNGQTNNSLVNAAAGTHTVTVTDAFGCEMIDSVVLTEPTAITATIDDHTDGTATVSASGGAAGYTYQWSPNTGNQTGATVTGLVAGDAYYVVVTDANGCTEVVSFQAVVLNVNTLNGVANMSMFPNPTHDNVFVKMDLMEQATVNIQVVNTIGQIVLQETFDNILNQTVELNTAKLPSGVYMVQFNIGEKSTTQKLIISKS
ncbi:fibronectin type III domain-containing protein [Aureispira sp. CCB-QB1]|uniref:fibronectin type III domain-containing protein n=1 Tax=Aureispira sp. CCB-QB1 TaxID=1313421 RepID=UPI00069688F5|nr:fibronectin type III domain-containing protein [Aureispira sp. CCB-QB1]